MDSEDELLLDALQLAELHRMREERAGPRSGNHPILKQRHEKGQFHTLYAELRQDEAKFKGFTRMKIATFDALLEILRTKITRNSMREPIAPEQRLLVTLKFLATGVSMRTLAYDFFLGDTTVREIVHSTCNAVVELMKDTYIRTPNTADEWREISEGFWDRWNLPNTLGAVDEKHVHLRAPANSGSLFFNYKGRFSTIMMAVADYRCRIVYLSVGSYGHEGDAGIFDRSDFGRALVDDANPLHLPDDSPLPGTDVMSSFFFVGDNAFPIHKRMMKPFTLRNMTRPKRIFNYRLSRGRRIVETTFGLLAARWRLLLKPMEASFDNCKAIVWTMCILHNFLIEMEGEPSVRMDPDAADPMQDQMDAIQNFVNPHANRGPDAAYEVRNQLVQFFLGPGAVGFQDERI